MRATRKYTNMLLEMVDEGILDKDQLIADLLLWMSEHDVEQFFDRHIETVEEE